MPEELITYPFWMHIGIGKLSVRGTIINKIKKAEKK
jgi:hypothetical protein